MSDDQPMGEHEAAVDREFNRFVESPRGEELARELCYLQTKLDTRKLADWAIEAIRKRQTEIMNELHQSDDWGAKLSWALSKDYADELIRTGRAGQFIRLHKARRCRTRDRRRDEQPSQP